MVALYLINAVVDLCLTLYSNQDMGGHGRWLEKYQLNGRNEIMNDYCFLKPAAFEYPHAIALDGMFKGTPRIPSVYFSLIVVFAISYCTSHSLPILVYRTTSNSRNSFTFRLDNGENYLDLLKSSKRHRSHMSHRFGLTTIL